MKFLHLSDLHLGKTVHEFSLIEDQEHILKSILHIANKERPQAVLIAGDIFDRAVAPTEALRLFDDFLDGFMRLGCEVFIISGNHDSPDRLAFGSRLMKNSGVHISQVYDGSIEPIVIRDDCGTINLYLMPFLKPVLVKRFFPNEVIESWTDAINVVIQGMQIDQTQRNILIGHQFVTGAATCESEELNIGGSDNVSADVFAQFDYVALGHLHGAQTLGNGNIRYCGTPLKYSFSETGHKKSVSIIELMKKDKLVVREVSLIPKRDMREVRGKYLDITAKAFYHGQNTEDYLHITLTDEEDQPDALAKLRIIYPNLMRLDYDNQRTRKDHTISGVGEMNQLTPLQLFEAFFQEQNNHELSSEQKEYMRTLIERVWEEMQ